MERHKRRKKSEDDGLEREGRVVGGGEYWLCRERGWRKLVENFSPFSHNSTFGSFFFPKINFGRNFRIIRVSNPSLLRLFMHKHETDDVKERWTSPLGANKSRKRLLRGLDKICAKPHESTISISHDSAAAFGGWARESFLPFTKLFFFTFN